MRRIEKYIFIGCGVMIVILWLLSSTDLILKEKEEEVYQISVIADDSDEKNWEYFQKGMEYAADQYHVEIKFVTLYDDITQEKQNEAIAEEAEGNAQVLIVCPVDVQELQEFLVENSLKEKPIITLKTKVQSDKVVSNIYGEETERGKLLAELIAQEEQKDVWIGIKRQKTEQVQEFCFALRERLEEHGIKSTVQIWSREEELDTVFQREENIFVGLDLETVELLVEKNEETKTGERKIYGNGINANVVHKLETRKIQGIAVMDETNMGCLAVASAVKLLQGEKTNDLSIDQYVIGSSEVYSQEYEQVLFPIS